MQVTAGFRVAYREPGGMHVSALAAHLIWSYATIHDNMQRFMTVAPLFIGELRAPWWVDSGVDQAWSDTRDGRRLRGLARW